MTPSGKVFLVSGVTDMRKSIDGLSLIVAEQLERVDLCCTYTNQPTSVTT